MPLTQADLLTLKNKSSASASSASASASGQRYQRILPAFRSIWAEEGLRGLFRGYRVTAVCVPLFHSLYFPLYETLKHRTQSFALAAAVSGAVCNIITNPFWVSERASLPPSLPALL